MADKNQQLNVGASIGAAAEPFKRSPRPFEGPVTHGNEEEDALFGNTGRPMEHPAFGGATTAGIGASFSQPPTGKEQWYAALRQASRDPDAPQSVKQLFSLVDAMQSNWQNPNVQPLRAQSPSEVAPALKQNPEAPIAMIGGAAGVAGTAPSLPPPGRQGTWGSDMQNNEAIPNANPAQLKSEDESPVQQIPINEDHTTSYPTGV